MNKDKIDQFAKVLVEAFFDGAVNLEENLPPGFNKSDIETVDQYTNDSSVMKEIDDVEPLLSPTDKGVKSVDMEPMLQNKREKGGKADHETPYIHRSSFTVVDDNDKPIDLEKLKSIITQRPTKILKQNTKIQKSGNKTYAFYNLTLPAYRGLWYDEKNQEFKIVTTCPSAGACKLVCYARKGGYVQFPAAFTASARVLNFLLNDWKGFKQQLILEIRMESLQNKRKGVETVLRWHDSGDFFNEKYLQIALDIARETPEVTHYAYTKSVGMVDKASKPSNFIFNYSLGGKEDKTVSDTNKKSMIVPKSLFQDLFPQKGAHLDLHGDLSPENLSMLVQRMASQYKLNPASIITYKQLLEVPYDPNTATPKYNVIVKPGDGDDSAMRKDVISTLLLIH